MKKQVPVSTIMTKNVIKLNLSDDLTKAEMLFKKHRIRHIPVVSDDEVVGMLSYTDLLRLSFADVTDTADADGITASGHNGVLEIAIPKRAESTPRRIQVGSPSPKS